MIVSETQGFMEALRAGQPDITISGGFSVPEPIDLSRYINSSFFCLRGAHGYSGGVLYRGFDGPQPVLSASHVGPNGKVRDWSLRFEGVTIDGRKDRYPRGGDNLRLEWVQLSIFRDTWLIKAARNGGTFGPLTVNASEFELFLMDNDRHGAELLNVGGVQIRGGAMERNGGHGLRLTGRPRRDGGATLVDSPHTELNHGDAINAEGVWDLTLRGGYYLGNPVRVTNCQGYSYDGRGQFIEGARFIAAGGPAHGI